MPAQNANEHSIERCSMVSTSFLFLFFYIAATTIGAAKMNGCYLD